MYQKVQFFPNLNALRFFAALLVLFHHAEVIRAKNNFVTLEQYSFFQNGTNAVKFFFVLSGFLITYLLLKEKEQSKTIHIGSFYFRRVIRIWPLYFLLVFIGTLLFPFIFEKLHIAYTFPYTFTQSWWLFLAFVPSLVTLKYGSHLLEPLWSIGVEEWFYVLWAPLFKWINKPLSCIYTVLALKIILLLLVHYHIIVSPIAVNLIKSYAFEAMAIGGLGAYLVFRSKVDIKKLYQKFRWVNYSLIALTLTHLFFNQSIQQVIPPNPFESPVFNWLILNILFVNLIIYCAIGLSQQAWLNNKWLDLFGKISYGIYMYHMLVIFTCIHLFKNKLLGLPPELSFFIFYVIVIPATILVSYLSKKYIEDYFMRFRNKRTS